MYPEIAYSGTMQLLLAVVTFSAEFFSMYTIADVILVAFKVSAGKKQKALFALQTGVLLHCVWVYALYMLGGMLSFNKLGLLLITHVNPISAMLYCYFTIRNFHLPAARSIKMISYTYLLWVVKQSFSLLMGSLFFVQTQPRYNFLLSILHLLAMLAILLLLCRIALWYIKRTGFSMDFVDNRFFNGRKELFFYFLKAVFAYGVNITLPFLIAEEKVANFIILLIQLFFIITMLLLDMSSFRKQQLENRDIHVSALFKGMGEFYGIKQDFYNILQTYSGYLEIADYGRLKQYHRSLVKATRHAATSVELGEKMQENPTLVSLITDKFEKAERMNVRLQSSLRPPLNDVYMDNADLCRMMGCLLDNAIEAAAASEQRRVYLSAEKKGDECLIFIITNSTDAHVDIDKILSKGIAPGHGQEGVGLSTVRQTAQKYGNCVFHMKYYNYELSIYLEIRKPTAAAGRG